MLACGNVCIVLQLTPHLCPALGAPAGFLPRVRSFFLGSRTNVSRFKLNKIVKSILTDENNRKQSSIG